METPLVRCCHAVCGDLRHIVCLNSPSHTNSTLSLQAMENDHAFSALHSLCILFFLKLQPFNSLPFSHSFFLSISVSSLLLTWEPGERTKHTSRCHSNHGWMDSLLHGTFQSPVEQTDACLKWECYINSKPLEDKEKIPSCLPIFIHKHTQ